MRLWRCMSHRLVAVLMGLVSDLGHMSHEAVGHCRVVMRTTSCEGHEGEPFILKIVSFQIAVGAVFAVCGSQTRLRRLTDHGIRLASTLANADIRDCESTLRRVGRRKPAAAVSARHARLLVEQGSARTVSPRCFPDPVRTQLQPRGGASQPR